MVRIARKFFTASFAALVCALFFAPAPAAAYRDCQDAQMNGITTHVNDGSTKGQCYCRDNAKTWNGTDCVAGGNRQTARETEDMFAAHELRVEKERTACGKSNGTVVGSDCICGEKKIRLTGAKDNGFTGCPAGADGGTGGGRVAAGRSVDPKKQPALDTAAYKTNFDNLAKTLRADFNRYEKDLFDSKSPAAPDVRRSNFEKQVDMLIQDCYEDITTFRTKGLVDMKKSQEDAENLCGYGKTGLIHDGLKKNKDQALSKFDKEQAKTALKETKQESAPAVPAAAAEQSETGEQQSVVAKTEEEKRFEAAFKTMTDNFNRRIGALTGETGQ